VSDGPTAENVVLVDVDDGIGTVTLNRPEARNAINGALGARLPAAIQELEDRDDVRVMILTGTDPAFCAGADLKELGDSTVRSKGADGLPMYDERGRLPFRGPFPPRTKLLIGAINGPAVTGGFEVALACDFLIASERARFADTHTRVGILPGWGLTVMLCQSVGVRRARELSATGNYLSAELALTWGLVNHVVPHEDLMPFTRETARAVVSNDQAAWSEMLRLYGDVAATTVDGGWELEAEINYDWQRRTFDPESVAARRDAIVARGRSQLGGSQLGG
jgi:enoyl-CoA hydratase